MLPGIGQDIEDENIDNQVILTIVLGGPAEARVRVSAIGVQSRSPVMVDIAAAPATGSSGALVEQLLARVRELESMVEHQRRVIAKQTDQIAE